MVDAVAVSLSMQDCRQYTAGSRQAGMSVLNQAKPPLNEHDGMQRRRVGTVKNKDVLERRPHSFFRIPVLSILAVDARGVI